MHSALKKLLIFIGVPVLIVVSLYLFRVQILWSTGNFLIYEDELEQVEALFVLGGGSYDRGNEAAKLFKAGFTKQIVCLGENVPQIFKALDLPYNESQVIRINLIKNNNVPDTIIQLLGKGTSTWEEAGNIIQYCTENNVKHAIVLSSKFHTRRIQRVFDALLRTCDIDLIIRGAPSSKYSEDEWWKTEEGLLMVNNEYVKLIYYFFKY